MCLTPYKFPAHLTIATPYPKKENTFPLATYQVWRAMFNCDFQVQQIRQTSFSLSQRVWVGDLLLYKLAWAQLPEDSRNATSFKRIGCEVGASHSMNLQIGGLASEDWMNSPRMEIWRWPVATVKVCKIRPGMDHSLFTIETRTNNKQILSRNSDKNADAKQNKQQTTK